LSAQVEFFCSAREELDLLGYLLSTGDVVVLSPRLYRENPFSVLDLSKPAPWPDPFAAFLWLRSSGPLQWYESRPIVDGRTHGELVNRLFASERWDADSPGEDEAMLDFEKSPIFVYQRSLLREGYLGPCILISQASNAERVSLEFAKWVRRCLSWVRRHSTRIHDYRAQHPALHNPDGLLNSIYAFPDAETNLGSGHHNFAIFVD
jgi:hypothetical protein